MTGTVTMRPIAQLRPARQPARTIATSEKNSANGGNPSRAVMPTTSGTARSGRRASSPRTSAMLVVPSAASTRPATTNRLALASPCPMRCSSTAARAIGPPTAAPTASTPMCSMLE